MLSGSLRLPRVVEIAGSDKNCALCHLSCAMHFPTVNFSARHREEEEAVDRHYIRCCLDEAPPSGDS